LLLCAAVAQAQGVSVELSIDSIQILIGDQTRLHLYVTMPQGKTLQMPEFQRAQPLIPGIEVLEQSKPDTTQLDGGMVRVERQYTLTSFDDSLYQIPGITVKVDGKEYQSQPTALKVLTIEVDTANTNQFFPPKDVQENPFQWNDVKLIFWLSLLLIILCIAAYYITLVLRGKKPVKFHLKMIRRLLPHQKAMKEIEEIKASKLTTSEDTKEYYTRLTDTLRKYIEERFGFSAMEMTSAEIIENLKANGDQKMIGELQELFQTADLVKFAKYSTLINENDMNLVNAVEFINTTKLEEMPKEEKEEPKLSKEDQKTRKSRIWLKTALTITIIAAVALLAYICYSLYML